MPVYHPPDYYVIAWGVLIVAGVVVVLFLGAVIVGLVMGVTGA